MPKIAEKANSVVKAVEVVRKRAWLPTPCLWGFLGNRQLLEFDLNRELHVKGFARTDARRAVEVTDGIRH